MNRVVIVLAACFAAAMALIQASASDVKLLTGALMPVRLPEVLPQFEKASGHKVTVEYGTLGAIIDRISTGEDDDLVIVTGAQNEQLQKEGKVASVGASWRASSARKDACRYAPQASPASDGATGAQLPRDFRRRDRREDEEFVGTVHAFDHSKNWKTAFQFSGLHREGIIEG